MRSTTAAGCRNSGSIGEPCAGLTRLAESEESDNRRKALGEALSVLNDRERRIFEARRLADDPITLMCFPVDGRGEGSRLASGMW